TLLQKSSVSLPKLACIPASEVFVDDGASALYTVVDIRGVIFLCNINGGDHTPGGGGAFVEGHFEGVWVEGEDTRRRHSCKCSSGYVSVNVIWIKFVKTNLKHQR